jgi:cytochrome c biogenesis protein CcmG/thiol:disulfide interchange protein DsbE
MTEQTNLVSPAGQDDLPEWLDQITKAEPQPDEPVKQRFSTFGVLALLGVIAAIVVIGYALYKANLTTPTEGPAPAFSAVTFDGEPISLDGWRGNAVVVNFWASYCAPCRDEAPMLERLWQEYRDRGVVFVGINTDDIERNARAYMDEFGITYYNAPDVKGKIEDDYRITGIPETFVINTEGEIVRHFLSTPRERELREEIERALNS